MTEVVEQEREALKSNIVELRRMKSDNTPDAAERSIKLAVQTANMLLGPEPRYSDNELALRAARARYEAGETLRFFGNEVVLVGSEEQKNDPSLLQKKALIEQAYAEGLNDETLRIAGEIAVRDTAKVKIEETLLAMAGAGSLIDTSNEKDAVFGERRKDHELKKQRSRRWKSVDNTNFDEMPAIQKLNELKAEVLGK